MGWDGCGEGGVVSEGFRSVGWNGSLVRWTCRDRGYVVQFLAIVGSYVSERYPCRTDDRSFCEYLLGQCAWFGSYLNSSCRWICAAPSYIFLLCSEAVFVEDTVAELLVVPL